MDWLPWAILGSIVVAGIVAAPSIHRGEIARRRRHGTIPGGFGVLDELFHPTVHESRIEQDLREEAGAESPAPGEPRWRLPTDR